MCVMPYSTKEKLRARFFLLFSSLKEENCFLPWNQLYIVRVQSVFTPLSDNRKICFRRSKKSIAKNRGVSLQVETGNYYLTRSNHLYRTNIVSGEEKRQ